MKRQVIGITIAVVLAVAGTFALISYVKSAKDDAIEDEQLTQVYVISDDIARGTPVNAMTDVVALTDVPARLVAPDAVTDLTTLDDTFVASVDLQRGEQLLENRLVDPRTLVRVDVPDGLQEITIALSPERAVGGELFAGDTVGVLFSFDPFQTSVSGASSDPAIDPPGDPAAPVTTVAAPTMTPNMTHFTLHKVLVTAIQFSRVDTQRAAEVSNDESTDTTLDPALAEAPAAQLLVTLAVSAPEAEQLVFASEFGSIWLTAEGPDATEEGTRILTLDGVYVTVPR